MKTYSENTKSKKEAEVYGEEIRGLRDKVFSLALETLGRQNRGEWFSKKQVEFRNAMASKYTDYEKCLAYHILIGSSVSRQEITRLDFPEPDSVKTFLGCLKMELEKKQENTKEIT